MTIRYRFPDELTYEITSADLAEDWLLMQKAGEKKVGKAHPSVIGVSKSDSNPAALGTAAPGTGTSVSRADHKHPTTGIGGSLVPSTDSTYDLGTASLSWRDLYIAAAGHVWLGSTTAGLGGGSGAVYFQTGSTVRCAIDSSGHFVPYADNTYDLGSATNSWRNVYIDGTTTASTILPRTDNAYDLGSSTYAWRDLYLDTAGHLWLGSSATGMGYSSAAIYFQTSSTPRCGVTSTGQFAPSTDNLYDLGLSSLRWDDVYATNGTIQTSNQEDKADIEDSDLGLDFVLALKPKSYRWASTRGTIIPPSEIGGEPVIERKPGVRRHYGLIAQDVRDSLAGKDFAGYCYDSTTETYGLRYAEFIAPLVRAIQELAARLDAVEGEKKV